MVLSGFPSRWPSEKKAALRRAALECDNEAKRLESVAWALTLFFLFPAVLLLLVGRASLGRLFSLFGYLLGDCSEFLELLGREERFERLFVRSGVALLLGLELRSICLDLFYDSRGWRGLADVFLVIALEFLNLGAPFLDVFSIVAEGLLEGCFGFTFELKLLDVLGCGVAVTAIAATAAASSSATVLGECRAVQEGEQCQSDEGEQFDAKTMVHNIAFSWGACGMIGVR